GSGAPSVSGIAVAGSVSVDVGLYSVVAYVSGATLNLQEDSSVTAEDESNIWTIGGAVAFGGKAGVGIGIGVNVLGSDGNPNTTSAYVENSTVTLDDGALEVSAENKNPSVDPRIVAITAAIGASTGSFAGAGMVSVNLINSETSARITGSTLEQPETSEGKASAVVSAADTSGIISVGGAVGVSTSGPSIGAAIGYNEIETSTVAGIESSTLSIGGDVSVTADAKATIVGV